MYFIQNYWNRVVWTYRVWKDISSLGGKNLIGAFGPWTCIYCQISCKNHVKLVLNVFQGHIESSEPSKYIWGPGTCFIVILMSFYQMLCFVYMFSRQIHIWFFPHPATIRDVLKQTRSYVEHFTISVFSLVVPANEDTTICWQPHQNGPAGPEAQIWLFAIIPKWLVY